MLRDFFLRPRAERHETHEIRGFRSTQPVDAAIAAVAASRHGVVTNAQLQSLGLTQRAIDSRVECGRLHRVHRGVYAVGHPALTVHGEFRAAVDAVGGIAGLSSRSALAVHGIRGRVEGEPVDVVADHRVRRRDGLRACWDADLRREDLMLREGIPVLFPSMSLLTAAGDLGERELRRAVNQALVLKRVSVPSLVEVIARHRGRRGVAKLARVLAAARPTRSDLEDAAVALFVAYGIAEYETNARLGPDEVDIFFPRIGLVVELDGCEFHDNPIARADDAAKQARLEARGLRVERLRWFDVTAGQGATVGRLAALGAERIETHA